MTGSVVAVAGAKLEFWLCHLQLTDLGQVFNFSKADSTSEEVIFRRLVQVEGYQLKCTRSPDTQ